METTMSDLRRYSTRMALLPVLLLTGEQVVAQSDTVFTEEDLFGDIPMVSGVSRFEQKLERAPASVTIISRDLIVASGAQTFVDIFRLVPGAQSYYVSNNRYGISYHGIGREFPNQIEVTVNGRSVYETLFASVSWGTLGIGLDDIDHIEIVRGSNAPAQGSNAFMGSINIVTRAPVQERGLTLNLAGGDSQTRRASLINNARLGEVDFRLSVGYDQNDGFPAVPDGSLADGQELAYGNLRGTYTPTVADTVDIFIGYAHNRVGWGDSDHPEAFDIAHSFGNFQSIDWTHTQNSKHEFQVQAYHNEFETSSTTRLGPLYTLLGIDDETAQFLTAIEPPPAEIVALFSQITGLDFDTSAAVLNELNTEVFGGFGQLTSERYDLQFQHTYSLSDAFQGTWGVGVRYDTLETFHPQSFTVDIDETNFRFYNHNEWRATEQVTFNLGAMVEDTHVGTLFSPRVSASYQLNRNNALRVGYARGNRAPSLLEANEESVAKVGDVIFDILRIADPGLAEETVDSYEIAYMFQGSNPDLSLDIRLFREEVTDVIDETRVPSPPEVEIFGDNQFKLLENRDYWELNGGEIQVNYQIAPSTFARFHYTSIDFDTVIPPSKFGFKSFSKDDRMAQRSAGILIDHRLSPNWSVSLTGYYQSELRWEDGDKIDDITRIDAQICYQFMLGSANGKVRFVAQNLGTTYSEFNDNNLFETRYFITAQLELPD